MDTRTPDLTYAEQVALAENKLMNALVGESVRLGSNPDGIMRDLALRLAMRAFTGPAHQDEHDILKALHGLDRIRPYNPEDAALLCEQVRDVAERRMKAAESRCANDCYSAWSMIHQIADEEADEHWARFNERDPITGKRVAL